MAATPSVWTRCRSFSWRMASIWPEKRSLKCSASSKRSMMTHGWIRGLPSRHSFLRSPMYNRLRRNWSFNCHKRTSRWSRDGQRHSDVSRIAVSFAGLIWPYLVCNDRVEPSIAASSWLDARAKHFQVYPSDDWWAYVPLLLEWETQRVWADLALEHQSTPWEGYQ